MSSHVERLATAPIHYLEAGENENQESGTNFRTTDMEERLEGDILHYMFGSMDPGNEGVDVVKPAHYQTLSYQFPQVTDHYHYAMALHELGHGEGKHTSEVLAWIWAARHAEEWTEEMEKSVRESMTSYGMEGEYLEEFVLRLRKEHESGRGYQD